MYTTEDLFRPNDLGVDVRPRQNLGTHEDLFLYEYARYILHKRLVKEGLLSPYACPFYPLTDIENRKTETYQNDQHVMEQINKSTIASKLQVNEERVKLKEEIPSTKREDTDEWIEVKNKTKQNIVKEKKTDGNRNYYNVIQEEEEREDRGIDRIKVENERERVHMQKRKETQ